MPIFASLQPNGDEGVSHPLLPSGEKVPERRMRGRVPPARGGEEHAPLYEKGRPLAEPPHLIR